jgi:hypothetical protein
LIIYSARPCHNCSPFFHALTLKVYPSALVAEVFAASALHMIAALGFFDPEFAEGTHLVFGTFDKFLESFFILVWINRCLIFFASHPLMIKSSAL